MKMSDEIRIKVFRYNPEQDKKPKYETYKLPANQMSSILDALIHIHEQYSGSLAFRYSCRIGRCGSCTILANKKPVCACRTLVEDGMIIEPLPNFPIIRDLVVDYKGYKNMEKNLIHTMTKRVR